MPPPERNLSSEHDKNGAKRKTGARLGPPLRLMTYDLRPRGLTAAAEATYDPAA